MDDKELIRRWPDRNCIECTGRMRPSIARALGEGALLLTTEVLSGGKTTYMVWMVCERCYTCRSESRMRLEVCAREGLYTHDMTAWVEKITGRAIDEEYDMADPLTAQEIMSLPPERRAQVIQLRLLVKALIDAGIDPARLRATVVQK